VMLGLGLNIVVGFAGLLDLGFVGFYAVGAYTYALLYHWGGWSFWEALPFSGAMAALFGFVLGFPVLRLRGDYLAIVTLGFGEIIRILLRNLDRPVNITNGPKGISQVDPVNLLGVNLGRTQDLFGLRLPSVYLYYYLFAALVVLILFACIRLERSRIGRAWVAIREDEDAAQAMGINTVRLKLLAFAIGAAFGGVSGVLFASFQGFVSPESFTLNESIAVLAMVVLGGMGHIPGVILGCVLLAALPEALRASMGPLQQSLFGQVLVDPEIIRQLFYGLALILAMLYRPAGLWPKGVAR
ncbi:MAG TPA: ABC transporter ATP-binding protein, partial [Pseudomonas sp.]|nr:ABC transporter ATP-binding protein [Pseudomonas sp.]